MPMPFSTIQPILFMVSTIESPAKAPTLLQFGLFLDISLMSSHVPTIQVGLWDLMIGGYMEEVEIA